MWILATAQHKKLASDQYDQCDIDSVQQGLQLSVVLKAFAAFPDQYEETFIDSGIDPLDILPFLRDDLSRDQVQVVSYLIEHCGLKRYTVTRLHAKRIVGKICTVM